MRISVYCTAIIVSVVIGHPGPAAAQVDQQRAQEFFKDVQAVCEPEGTRLWSLSMCGPMVIAEHGFSGADSTRANGEMLRWFEQHLRGAAK
jgi:hypothetical protein